MGGEAVFVWQRNILYIFYFLTLDIVSEVLIDAPKIIVCWVFFFLVVNSLREIRVEIDRVFTKFAVDQCDPYSEIEFVERTS